MTQHYPDFSIEFYGVFLLELHFLFLGYVCLFLKATRNDSMPHIYNIGMELHLVEIVGNNPYLGIYRL